MRAVTFRRGDIRFMRHGLAGQQADLGIVPALGQVVAGLQSVFATAKLARRPGGEVIGKRQKDFRAKGLQQGAPRFPRQRGLERTDALRGDDRDALGLTGEAEELLSIRVLA